MKKWGFLMLLALLCCLTVSAMGEDSHWHEWVHEKYDNEYHHLVCAICGEAMEGLERHGVFCDSATPNICLACGATAEEGADIQKVHEWDLTGDEDATWYYCRTCGEIMPDSLHVHEWECVIHPGDHRIECKGCEMVKSWDMHSAPCSAPDVCQVCGAKAGENGVYIQDIYHSGEEVIRFNSMYHWSECEGCGEKFSGEDLHYASSCLEPTVCAFCGASTETDGISMLVLNHGALRQEFDEYYHWYVCDLCGVDDFSKSEHYASCAGREYCQGCGKSTVYDGIAISSYTHSWYGYEADETSHRAVCMICGDTFDEGPHWVSCLRPGECAVCGIPFQGEPVHEKNLNECRAVNEACHQFECYYCGETAQESHHFVDNVCRDCGFQRIVEDWRYNQTVCSLGIRFRDIAPQLTSKWFMFTPLDLSADGSQTIPLIAANDVYIGAVTVTVSGGKVTVNYLVDYPAVGRDMAFALLPSLDSVTDVDMSQMKTFAFDEEISVQDDLDGDSRVLLYVLGHADYDAMDGRNQSFAYKGQEYQDLVGELKELMD